MKLSLNASMKQSLKQQLNPKLIQMFKMFHSSYSDIVDEITRESEDNVFIEITQEDQLLSKTSKSSKDSMMTQDISEFTKDTHEETLQEFAFAQLKLIHVNDTKKAVIHRLIEGLNSKGFFEDFAALKKEIMNH